MKIVYAFNLRTDRPGIYMPAKVWALISKVIGQHWDAVGSDALVSHRDRADVERRTDESGYVYA